MSEVGWQELRDGTGGPSGQIRSSGVDRQPVFVTKPPRPSLARLLSCLFSPFIRADDANIQYLQILIKPQSQLRYSWLQRTI